MVNAVASWDGGTMLIDVDREDTEMSAVQTQARALRSCWAGNGGLYAVDMYVFYFNIYIYILYYIYYIVVIHSHIYNILMANKMHQNTMDGTGRISM